MDVEKGENGIKYHLRIRIDFEKKNEYLKKNELLRTISYPYKIIIENIGENDFPGGIITKLNIVYVSSRSEILSNGNCPNIKKGNSHILYEDIMIPPNEGLAWFYLYITSSDNEKINFYQVGAKDPLKIDHWVDSIYVLNRENYYIMKYLKNINDIILDISKEVVK